MSERPSSFDVALLAAIPVLRRQCFKLTKHREAAEDLASDTICRALSNWRQFDETTNIAAWLSTIARNAFLSGLRKDGRLIADPDGLHAGAVAIGGNQEHKLACDEVFARIRRMPTRQRHAVIGVALGDSYDEVAEDCGLPVGTVKSELHRARLTLKEIVA